jgi:hypothetical protein
MNPNIYAILLGAALGYLTFRILTAIGNWLP